MSGVSELYMVKKEVEDDGKKMLHLPDEAVFKENIHRRHLMSFLSGSLTELDAAKINQELILLCFTNRCGSNYLCDLLSSTGEFNSGGEFFNYDSVIQNIQLHGLGTFEKYFEFLFGLARHGRLVCKTSIDQIVLLARCGLLDRMFPRTKFVYVERGDTLGQAISLAIADQTGEWASYMKPVDGSSKPIYSEDVISTLVAQIVKEQYLFKMFFGLNGITPHLVVYEQLEEDPFGAVRALCRSVGAPHAPPRMHELRMRKQATGLNEEWRERYLSRRSPVTELASV